MKATIQRLLSPAGIAELCICLAVGALAWGVVALAQRLSQ